MFRRKTEKLEDIILKVLREEKLETPLLQKHIIDAWPDVVGDSVNRYTRDMYIKNQILFVYLTSPALRSDLMMMRKRLVSDLNQKVGSKVIIDIQFR
jgi:predicted nucleic acid-binding Zn ribbon protein